MARHAQLITTTETKEQAEAIASSVLQSRHAACVQILGPIQSRYWWKERLEVAEEWLCLMKTTIDKAESLTRAVLTVHPYETPEVTVTEIVGGNPSYLAWIDAETNVTPPL